MTGIIDAHIHFSGEKDDELNRFAELNGLKYDFEELLGLMDEHGVERGLLLSPPMKGWEPLPNSKVIELCNKSRDKLFPILTVEPKNVADTLKLAKENMGRVKGFKIRLGYVKIFAANPVYDRLYDYAESEDLPVMYHTGDTATNTGSLKHAHPLTLDTLANARTELKIVACHFGNPWISDVAELIYKHPNVYADISGLATGGSKYADKYIDSLARKLTEAIYFAGGAHKVLFGTDYPVETYSDALSLVKKMGIDEEDKQRILTKNAKWVFPL